MKSFAIIGAGRFGYRLATELAEHDVDVMVIDKDETTINHIAEYVTRAVVADSTDKDVLRHLGVQDCDVVIMAHAIDLSSSVLTTMHLKTLGVKNLICKAKDETHYQILEKLGADRVIMPERMLADKLAINLTNVKAMDLIDLSTDCGIIEVPTPERWANKTIIQLDIRKKFGINLIAIKKEDNTIDVDLTPDTVLPKNATLVLLGHYEKLNNITE